MDNIFAWFVIKSGRLRSTYESNVENAVLVPYLIIIIGLARQAARRMNWALSHL